jgi:Asp-tRNA(Asn)/Glu-tRNA(Gln) amidotransferase A subunit family amidase
LLNREAMFYKTISLSEVSNLLKNGDLELLSFINELCDRIEKVEPEIHSLLPEENRRERLLSEAKQLIKKYPDKETRPLFFGVPIGVKDIFRTDGFQTHCGSSLPAELFEGQEASCVGKLKNAGALILGKTVTTEFAYFEPGPTKNPNNTDYSPGGSSSGSAAAVAAGIIPFAFGTQTIGSVIRPAAYCGVIGFKPSYGRIATDGVIPFSQSADHIGFYTQDIDGCILAASVLCDGWNDKITSEEIKRPLILGVSEGKYLYQSSDEILENFEKNIERLESHEIEVRRIKMFDTIEQINKAHRLMVAAEMAEVHREWYKKYKDLYRPHTREIIEDGMRISASQLEEARQGRLLLRNEIESLKQKEKIDLWVSPSVLTMSPKGLSSTGSPLMNLPWTYAGLPAITIPLGRLTNNLPYGIQFCASFGEDERLLNSVRSILEIL